MILSFQGLHSPNQTGVISHLILQAAEKRTLCQKLLFPPLISIYCVSVLRYFLQLQDHQNLLDMLKIYHRSNLG